MAAARTVAIAAIIAGSAAALYAERATIHSGLDSISHANAGWVMTGFAAERASMAAFTLLQQQLLRAGGTTLTFGELLSIAYTSNAISVAVPAVGSGMAVVYSQRRFQARGADAAKVSLALLVAGVVSTVAFAIIVAIGAMASGNPAASVAGLLTSLSVAVAAGCLVAVLHSPRGRARLQPPFALTVRSGQRLAHSRPQ